MGTQRFVECAKAVHSTAEVETVIKAVIEAVIYGKVEAAVAYVSVSIAKIPPCKRLEITVIFKIDVIEFAVVQRKVIAAIEIPVVVAPLSAEVRSA